jgi:hypothetical protein
MKISALLLATLALTILSGCVSPQINYRLTTKDISFPPLDKVVVAEIGDELVKQGTFSEQDAIYLANPVKISWAYVIEPGNYVKRGSDGSREYFVPSYNGANSGKITKAALADPWQYVSYKKNNDQIGIVTVLNVNITNNASGYVSFKKLTSLAENSFQQTLIYSGCTDDMVTLGYREFSNNNARPAFNNDVEYDLKSSKIIGYKGARIEVIEADNQNITYKVLSNFNPL